MIYALEMGRDEKTIIEQLQQQRLPLPEKILGAPQLELGLELYYVGFQKLCTDRALSMGGEGPIPWSSLNTYCKENEIEGDQRQDFEAIIEKMDDAFLQWRVKKQKEQKDLQDRGPRKVKRPH